MILVNGYPPTLYDAVTSIVFDQKVGSEGVDFGLVVHTQDETRRHNYTSRDDAIKDMVAISVSLK